MLPVKKRVHSSTETKLEAVQDVSSVLVQLDTHQRLVDSVSVQCSALARVYMQNICLTCKEACIMCEKRGSLVPSLLVVRRRCKNTS
jgi:hypothetical protein